MKRTEQKNYSLRFRGVAALLVASNLIAPVTWAQNVPGVPSEGADAPGYRVSIGLPSQGYLDAYHSADSLIARPSEASLYAIRNVVVEDLLKSRLGLRELLNHPSLDFRAPPSVSAVYLNASNPGTQLSLIADLIGELDQVSRGSANLATRRRLSAGLLFYSAQIVQAERVLRFLTEDYYNDPKVSDVYERQVLKPYLSNSRITLEDRRFLDLSGEARKIWVRARGVSDQIAEWAGLREAILNRYPMLSVRVDHQPLYARLYEAATRFGLTPAKTALHAVSGVLPMEGQNIEIPVEQLEATMLFARKAVASAEPEAYSGADPALIEGLARDLDPLIDHALLDSLTANTEFLAKITENPNFDGETSSVLFKLSDNAELWRQARERYGYLGALIDFDRAQTELSAQQRKIRSRHQKISMTLWGSGAVLATVAMATGIGWLGVDGAILGLAGETVGFASSGLFAVQSVYQYTSSRKVAEIARQLFSAKLVKPAVSAFDAENAEIHSQADFRDMIVYGAVMGFMPTLGALMRSSEAIIDGGAKLLSGTPKFVRSTRSAMSVFRAKLLEMGEGEIRFAAPGGRLIRSRLREVAGLPEVATARTISLEEAVIETARATGAPSASVWAKLKDMSAVEKFRKAWNIRQAASNGKFGRFMLSEQVAGLVLDSGADLKVRGVPNTAEAWRKFGLHVTTGALVNFLIVWRITGIKRIELPSNPTRLDKIKNWDSLFRQNSVTLYTTGAMAGSASTAIDESVRHFTDPNSRSWLESAKSVAANGTYWASYMGVSSALRYGFVVGPTNNAIGKVLERRAARLAAAGLQSSKLEGFFAKTALLPVSMANSFFGSWQWVQGAEFLQIQGASSEAKAELADGLWIRLDQPAGGAAELFDFLPSAAHAPIVVTAN